MTSSQDLHATDDMEMTLEDEEVADAMDIDADEDSSDGEDSHDDNGNCDDFATGWAKRQSKLEADEKAERSQKKRAAKMKTLDKTLKSLTLKAQSQLQDQPRHTQLALTNQTREIYKDYETHGSMLGLKKSIADFLRGHDDEGTTYWSAEEAAERKAIAHTQTLPQDYSSSPSSQSTITPIRPECSNRLNPFTTPVPSHDLNASASPTLDPNEPISDSDLDSITNSPISNPSTTTLPITPHPSASASTLAIIRQLPFNPSSITLRFPTNLSFPPNLLTHISHILALNNAHANALLFHHTNKYLNPALSPFVCPSPSALPLLRLGISEYISSQTDTVFDTATTHPLGLSPETRQYLRGIYEQHPSLNPVEKRLLARACRVGEETVEGFWTDMSRKRRAWLGMRLWMLARERERGWRAMEEGRG